MRRARLGLVLIGIVVVIGCQGAMPSVPVTPPPEQAPTLAPGAALRPYYLLRGVHEPAGTAFVIQDKQGKSYMLTAAHVIDTDAEWEQVKGASLRLMSGEQVATLQGRPLYLGKPFDVKNASVDLVIWPLADGSKAPALKLAAEDPKRNEWVWAVGQESSSIGPQKLYRCKVTGTTAGGLSLQQHDRFQMRGFSGGPVVNAQGEVVGSILGDSSWGVIVSRVSSIRSRLTEAGVQLP